MDAAAAGLTVMADARIRVIARLGLFQAQCATKRCSDHMIGLSDPLGPAGEPGSLINGCVKQRMMERGFAGDAE